MAVDTRYVTHDKWTGYTATDLKYPSTRQVGSGYDALYRRNSITEASGSTNIASWRFFGGRTATVTLGNGMVTSYMNNAQSRSAIQYGQTTPAWGDITTDQLGYDGAGRLIGKRHFNASTGVLVGNTTSYDPSSNKLFERALHAESRSSLYDSYDSMDRLLDYQRGVLASGGGGITTDISLPGTNQEQAYNLDALGNWSTTTITPEGGTASTQTRTHNLLNEVTQYGVYPAMTPVLYDQGNNSGTPPQKGSGNIINDGLRTYTYDALNRVITVSRVSDGVQVAAYTYDALGRRTRKVVTNGGVTYPTNPVANATFRYVYDGNQIAEELSGTNATTRQFVWGQYIDELVQMKTYTTLGAQNLPAGSYYLLSDLLYRSVALTNTSGTIVEAYDTDAYGNTLIFSAPDGSGNWFGNNAVQSDQPVCTTIFTGRQFDPETGNYFYRARYYEPPLGRFIGRDLAGYRDSHNLFEYVLSGPSSFVDPIGLVAQSPPCSCGPDVTDWYAKEVMRFYKLVETSEHEDYGPFWTKWQRLAKLGRLADYKSRRFTKQGKEPSTVTLCGKCIPKNQLGNIMFGIVAGDMDMVDDARNYGHGHGIGAWLHGGPSTPWGKARYKETAFDIGVAFNVWWAKRPQNTFYWDVKDALCNLVKAPWANEKNQNPVCNNIADPPCDTIFDGPLTTYDQEPQVDEGGNIRGH